MGASQLFKDRQIAALRDPEQAAFYLEEALAAGDMEAFKLALRNVAEARVGGMSALARSADLNRESLYRAFSPRGNPNLRTLTKALTAMGLRISVAVGGRLSQSRSKAKSD